MTNEASAPALPAPGPATIVARRLLTLSLSLVALLAPLELRAGRIVTAGVTEHRIVLPDAAVTMSRDSLDIYRAALGEDHPAVAREMSSLGMWLSIAGESNVVDVTQALSLLREQLDEE